MTWSSVVTFCTVHYIVALATVVRRAPLYRLCYIPTESKVVNMWADLQFRGWLGRRRAAILSSTCHFIHFLTIIQDTGLGIKMLEGFLRFTERRPLMKGILFLENQNHVKFNVGRCREVVSENSWSYAEDSVAKVQPGGFWETFWLSPGWFIINEIWPLAARRNYHLTLSLCNNGPKLCCRAIRRQHRLHHHHHHPNFNRHYRYHPQSEQQNRHIESHLHEI